MHFNKIDLNSINFEKPELNSFQLLSQIIPNITKKYKTKIDDSEDYATSNNVLKLIMVNTLEDTWKKVF